MMRNYNAWQEGEISRGPWWRSNTATSRRILQLTKTIFQMQTLKHVIVNISYWSTKDTLAQVGRLSFFVCGAVSRLLYTVISRRIEKEQHTSGPPAASSPISTKGPWLAFSFILDNLRIYCFKTTNLCYIWSTCRTCIPNMQCKLLAISHTFGLLLGVLYCLHKASNDLNINQCNLQRWNKKFHQLASR